MRKEKTQLRKFIGLTLVLALVPIVSQVSGCGGAGGKSQVDQKAPEQEAAYPGTELPKPPEAANGAGSQTAGEAVQKGPDGAQQSNQQSKGGGVPGGGPRMTPPQDDIARILGMTAEELQTALKAGSTLEQIAAKKGMTLEQLKEQWLAGKKAELDSQVSQGRLTAEQAQNMMARLQNMDLGKLAAGPEMGAGGPFKGLQQAAPPGANQQN
ncbi:MAG: hypothetical protein K6T65_15190 [Peptococcaceae bacterium]|nr:hypothetical protein [Peptococcaceae bacterium]